jgi:hypothetical protein
MWNDFMFGQPPYDPTDPFLFPSTPINPVPVPSRPKPGYKLCQLVTPNQNGCGAKNGFKIPFQDTGLWSFTPACNAHDLCYGTCGSDKADCDRKFRDDMYEACEAYNRWLLPPLGRMSIYRACKAEAYTFYKYVKNCGQGPFDAGQVEGKTCLEIPEDECCPVPEGKPEKPNIWNGWGAWDPLVVP